jgi:hypothetical protein
MDSLKKTLMLWMVGAVVAGSAQGMGRVQGAGSASRQVGLPRAADAFE